MGSLVAGLVGGRCVKTVEGAGSGLGWIVSGGIDFGPDHI